jgi:hypothetical protein
MLVVYGKYLAYSRNRKLHFYGKITASSIISKSAAHSSIKRREYIEKQLISKYNCVIQTNIVACSSELIVVILVILGP